MPLKEAASVDVCHEQPALTRELVEFDPTTPTYVECLLARAACSMAESRLLTRGIRSIEARG